jgi:hypothetical protein
MSRIIRNPYSPPQAYYLNNWLESALEKFQGYPLLESTFTEVKVAIANVIKSIGLPRHLRSLAMEFSVSGYNDQLRIGFSDDFKKGYKSFYNKIENKMKEPLIRLSKKDKIKTEEYLRDISKADFFSLFSELLMDNSDCWRDSDFNYVFRNVLEIYARKIVGSD